jgi:hypothetical protein
VNLILDKEKNLKKMIEKVEKKSKYSRLKTCPPHLPNQELSLDVLGSVIYSRVIEGGI